MPRQSFKRPAYAPAGKFQRRPRYATMSMRPAKKNTLADIAKLAKQAYKGYKSIKRVLNTEEKIFDQPLAVFPDSTGVVQSLFAPTQGDTFNQRDGDSVRPLNLEVKWHLNYVVGSTTTPKSIRLIIFRAYGEHATAVTMASLIEVLTAGVNITSPIKYSNRERFTVLYDHTEVITPLTGDNPTSNGYFVSRLTGHTLFTPAAVTIEDGGLYLAYFSDAASDNPGLTFYSRTWFSDT